MNTVIKEITGSTQGASKRETLFVDEKLSIDAKLLRAYLRPSQARQTANFHVRRTLDQFYYTFGGTEARDIDQLVYRRTGPYKQRIFMVEELWLWTLDESWLSSPSRRILI